MNYKLDLICNMSISVLSFITIIGILSRVELTDGQRIPVSEDQHKKIREQYSRFIRKDIFND